jgi:N-formylmaleamate deformylase
MKTLSTASAARLLFPLGLSLWLTSLALAGNPHPDFEVTVSGQGKPVVFIPGLATPGVIWQPVIDQLPAGYQCHVITMAGFGQVKPSGSDPFLSKVRDELIDYMRAEKLDHPIIVGHSLGGFMGLWIAETAPALPGRLVVVDALPYLPAILNPNAGPEAMRAQISPMIAQMARASPAQFTELETEAISVMVTSPDNVRKVIALTEQSDPKTTARAMEELMTTDLRPGLDKIRCPVLVLVSLADKVAFAPKETAMTNFRRQYDGLRGVRFEGFDNAKHFIMVDDLPAFMQALEADLKAAPQGPR